MIMMIPLRLFYSCQSQYKHLIPAPVDRTPASAWLYKHPRRTCKNNKPSTSMTSVACESKLYPVVRVSVHTCTCPGSWLANSHTVVYYALATRAFSTGIRCWHCILCTCIWLTTSIPMHWCITSVTARNFDIVLKQ